MTFIILYIILGMVVAEKEAGIINPIKAMRQIKSREREYRKQLISRPKWEFISSNSARRFCATFLCEKKIHPTKIIIQRVHSSINDLHRRNR
jgi:hypothetical protein